jgi:hypothetical protein
MKQLFRYLLLPILGLGLTAVRSAEPSNVRISFVQPERFSDFRIQGRQEIVSAAIFRDDVSTYLSPIVAKRFPGCTLSLKFTNIDLAGRIATSHPLKLNNVRIDRNIAFPLRLYFDYQLSDSHGRTLAAGSKGLVDTDYLYRYNYYPNQTKTETLFYEKVTLYRWLSTVTPSGVNVDQTLNFLLPTKLIIRQLTKKSLSSPGNFALQSHRSPGPG